METISSSLMNSIIANTDQVESDDNKASQTLQDALYKEDLAKTAILNEESAKQLAEEFKKKVEDAKLIATQVIDQSVASQEVQQHLVDSIIDLTEKSKLAQYEVEKASEERIKATQSAEIALQQAKFAQDLTKLTDYLDITNMKPSIVISNKVTKGKFKLVDGFQLKCPDDFIQQGTYCGRLIELSNSSFGDGDIEGFENTKEDNTIIILLILVLLAILYYRNKEMISMYLGKYIL
jgi:hypothetical protein